MQFEQINSRYALVKQLAQLTIAFKDSTNAEAAEVPIQKHISGSAFVASGYLLNWMFEILTMKFGVQFVDDRAHERPQVATFEGRNAPAMYPRWYSSSQWLPQILHVVTF